MEIFLEKAKKIIPHIACFMVGCILSFTITFTFCNKRTDRANSEIAALRNELSNARAEVERTGRTIKELRTIQSEITTGLGDCNTELHSIIERLQFIRDKVQDIENLINDYYSNNNSNNHVLDNKDL